MHLETARGQCAFFRYLSLGPSILLKTQALCPKSNMIDNGEVDGGDPEAGPNPSFEPHRCARSKLLVHNEGFGVLVGHNGAEFARFLWANKVTADHFVFREGDCADHLLGQHGISVEDGLSNHF